VATRSIPPHTEAEIDRGVPLFLDHLVDALRLGLSSRLEIGGSAVLHSRDLVLQGFTVSQAVRDYGDVCQSITELAVDTSAPISTEDLRLLNGCLDNAIAAALTRSGPERHQSSLDGDIVRDNERLGFFAHELRNLINTAMIAFELIKSRNVDVGESAGMVLHRSLVGARDFIARSLAEVRLAQGVQKREPFLVSGFIDELMPAALLTAHARSITLALTPVEEGVAIEADRHVLAAVMMNVLQNAFKFTRPRTTVTLRVEASADRVLIEIQDECGGLPGGDLDGLFRPFEQRSADRTGFGLGLAFSRWATEANHGRISARNLSDVGCVFTVDLPRCPAPALATA
jgi:signal transduction histidine kinase